MYKFFAIAILCCAASCATELTDDITGDAPLQISTLDDTTIAGTFVHAGSVIVFRATSADQEVATLELDVNGAEIEVVLDIADQTFDQEGHLNALYEDDLAALLALRDEIQAAYPDLVTGTLQGKLLARHADRLAEAPAGYTLDHRFIDLKIADQVQDRTHLCGDNGTSCLCDDCDSRSGTAAWDSRTRSCYYDTYHTYGEKAPDCQGRCGAGCNHWFDDDYTQDCFDHDICLVHNGGSVLGGNPDCGDEFWDADDDYVKTYVAYC